jgi:class 3 adenylate cyclase
MSDYPSGTVSLLFTDIEGSTLLLRRLGDRYGDVLATHRRLLREAFTHAHGHEIDTQGDAFFVAFARARDAVAAAAEGQRLLTNEQWPEGVELRVRMGIHTGEPSIGDEGYLGLDVHRGARICAAAHGGQVVVSQATRELVGDVLPAGTALQPLGEHRLKDLPRPETLFQLVVPGLRSAFPPVKDLDLQHTEASPFGGRERELGAKARHAASAAGGRLIRTFARRDGQSHRGFADFGWSVRGMLASARPELQEELAALGGDLFTLGRTTAECDRYLESIDNRLLDRELREGRELAVVSRQAAAEADALEKRIAQLRHVARVRESLADLAAKVETTIQRVRGSVVAGEVDASRADIEGLRTRIQRAEHELHSQLEDVRKGLGYRGIALRHTRHRGVFRVGSRYVVPFVNEVGIEQRREFSSLEEAHSFRRSVRLADREEEWSDGSLTGMRPWGAEQGIMPPRDRR